MKKKNEKDALREREERLYKMKDSDIDYSDIPPITKEFIDLVENKKNKKQTKQGLYILVKPEVLQWYRNLGRGYQGTINLILESYIEFQEQRGKRSKRVVHSPKPKRTQREAARKS